MKKLSTIFLSALMLITPALKAEELVIIHTNDTHSIIEPDKKGLGGWFRHKALIDSIKSCNENVILVDAGDAVQGSVYFNLYRGELEYKLKELMGYDYCILGNHDFDYADSVMIPLIKNTNLKWISSNYLFKDKEMSSRFAPYYIREVAGKKIAFMGININPDGLITPGNYDTVEYVDAVKAAHITSQFLKQCLKADIVVAITHIGYKESNLPYDDLRLRATCPDIDIIIGGHSHSEVTPGEDWIALGDSAIIAQAYKYGYKVGQFTIDLDKMQAKHHLYTIDSRYDRFPKDSAMEDFIKPYVHGKDSVNSLYISNIPKTMEANGMELRNFLADFMLKRGEEISGAKPDLAIINKGSIRQPWMAGKLSEGDVMSAQPFSNYVTVQEIPGDSLISCFDFMALSGGQGVSAGVEAKMAGNKCEYVKINGKPIDPNKTYRLATINYVATGGDNFSMLKCFPIIYRSENFVQRDLINYIKKYYPKNLKYTDKQRMFK